MSETTKISNSWMLEDLTSGDGLPVYHTAKGQEVMESNDAIKANNALLKIKKYNDGASPVLSDRELQPNGLFYERSLVKGKVAVNMNAVFANRFRKVVTEVPGKMDPKTKQQKTEKVVHFEVVRDYLAVQQQKTGRIHSELLVAYIIEQKNVGRGKQIACTGTKMVTDREFITEFTETFSRAEMMQVFESLHKYAQGDITEPEESSTSKLVFE